MKRSGSGRSCGRRSRSAARPARGTGIQATEIAEDQRRHQREDALSTPLARVCAPLLRFTTVAPHRAGAGMPPTADAATLAMPWATSLRLESWRVRVS